ncbi:MAG TPA: RloB family protein, partial [Arachidicoccus sp.]|nr:RloB family protein [Arachidicoccus sp.]
MKMQDKRKKEIEARAAHIAKRKAAKERHRTAPVIERAKLDKPGRQRILIYCEGANTEPSYFRKFELTNIEVKCYGEGRNTLSLVERAIELREQAKMKNKPYDQVWCVFDRDPAMTNKSGHTAENYNEAIRLAEKENIGAAYSNQAFEYWLILHFLDHQGGPLPRTGYSSQLNTYLKPYGCTYEGNDSKTVTNEIFDTLEAIDAKTGKRRRILAEQRA